MRSDEKGVGIGTVHDWYSFPLVRSEGVVVVATVAKSGNGTAMPPAAGRRGFRLPRFGCGF